jgi:hypothetical protein
MGRKTTPVAGIFPDEWRRNLMGFFGYKLLSIQDGLVALRGNVANTNV